MITDLLNQELYRSYNIKSAKIFGLHTAIYIELLIAINGKALYKNKDDDGFVNINRTYVTEQTTLTLDEQYEIDKKLVSLGLMHKKQDNKNKVSFDFKLYFSIITEDNLDYLDEIKNKVKIKKESLNEKKRKKVNSFKDSVRYECPELKQKMWDWIDAIVGSGKALNEKAITTFEDKLDEYTGHNLDVALGVVDAAIIHTYTDCYWAIESYRKKLVHEQENVKTTDIRVRRVTQQFKADSTELLDETF